MEISTKKKRKDKESAETKKKIATRIKKDVVGSKILKLNYVKKPQTAEISEEVFRENDKIVEPIDRRKKILKILKI